MEKVLIKEKQSFKFSLMKRVKASRFLIMMIIPAIIYYAIFCYIPMYGVLIAFTYYSPRLGIMGSVTQNWIGFDNFKYIFEFDGFWEAFKNTLIIGSIKVVISFVSAVIIALLINEIRMKYPDLRVTLVLLLIFLLIFVIILDISRIIQKR